MLSASAEMCKMSHDASQEGGRGQVQGGVGGERGGQNVADSLE